MDATLDAARTLVAACRDLVDGAVARLAGAAAVDGRVDVERLDREQVLAYDLASAASRVAAAEELLAYGERGGLEERLAVVFAGETAADLVARTAGREQDWGISGGFALAEARDALSAARSVALLDEVAAAVLENPDLPRHLPEELALARQTFKDFAEAEVRPVAERVHREDADIPDEVIAELGGMGCFGLSIPERHGGFAQGRVGRRLPLDGGGDRGAQPRLVGGRGVADHAPGDPLQGAGQGRDARAAGALAPADRVG